MFKWVFLERENIVDSRTDLHLSLPGLDPEIMAIKDWLSQPLSLPCCLLAQAASHYTGREPLLSHRIKQHEGSTHSFVKEENFLYNYFYLQANKECNIMNDW